MSQPTANIGAYMSPATPSSGDPVPSDAPTLTEDPGDRACVSSTSTLAEDPGGGDPNAGMGTIARRIGRMTVNVLNFIAPPIFPPQNAAEANPEEVAAQERNAKVAEFLFSETLPRLPENTDGFLIRGVEPELFKRIQGLRDEHRQDLQLIHNQKDNDVFINMPTPIVLRALHYFNLIVTSAMRHLGHGDNWVSIIKHGNPKADTFTCERSTGSGEATVTQSLETLQAKAKWWLKACDALNWSSARVHIVVIIKIIPAVRTIFVQTWTTLPLPRVDIKKKKKKGESQTIFGSINARMMKQHGQAPESTDRHPFVMLQSIRIEMMDPKRPASRPLPSTLQTFGDQIGPNERFTVDGERIKHLEVDDTDGAYLDGSHPLATVLAADHPQPRVDNLVSTAVGLIQSHRGANDVNPAPILTPPSPDFEAPSVDLADAGRPVVEKTVVATSAVAKPVVVKPAKPVTDNHFEVSGGDLILDIDDLLGRERNSREPAVRITKSKLITLAEVIWLGLTDTMEEVD